ncbi:MAG: asparagine--tRNA ligase [Caldiserica bacterium]|nr:asparagine--tRNA ligase [Caldisericota bacterium]
MYIDKAADYVGQVQTIHGWIYNSRSSGKVAFVLVRDGTGIMQCVVAKSDVDDSTFESVHHLTQESSVSITGTVHAEERAPGGHEMHVQNIEVHQLALDYPITPKEHGVDFLMGNRHLWLRSKRQWAIMRIRATIVKSIRDYLDDNGFLLMDAPILSANACEGSSTLFSTDYFGVPAYLSQSGQLYNEATAMAFGKVYCFGPAFRAEKSKTRRHLTEFWMVEPEMAYCDWLQNCDVQERFVTYIVQQVLEKRKEELSIIERDTSPLEKIATPFPRISYDEAVKLLQKAGSPIRWGDDFGGDEETLISNQFERPVFVHSYPKSFKAFYMKTNPANPQTVLCADLLAPEGYGEIIGGGQREDDYELLLARVHAEGLAEADYQWYLDLRKYGSVPHSGFGLGVERTVAWICKLPHVRETVPFPRLLEKIYP